MSFMEDVLMRSGCLNAGTPCAVYGQKAATRKNGKIGLLIEDACYVMSYGFCRFREALWHAPCFT
jgi:hypothetical protein